MTLDAVKNFAFAKLSRGYGEAANVVELESGGGSKFPDPSTEGEYNLVWWNETDYNDPATDPEVEIVRVTGKTGDILTILRAQENTPATIKNRINKEYRFTLTLTAKVIDDIKAKFLVPEKGEENLFSTSPDKMVAAADIKKGDLLKLTEGEFAKVDKIKSDFSQIKPDAEYLIENNNISKTKSIKYADNKILVARFDGTSIRCYIVSNVAGKLIKSEEYLVASTGSEFFDLNLTDDGNVILFSGDSNSILFGKVINPYNNCKIVTSSSINLSVSNSSGIKIKKGSNGKFVVLHTTGSSYVIFSVWSYKNEYLEHIHNKNMTTGVSTYAKNIDMAHHKEDEYLVSYIDQDNKLQIKLMKCNEIEITESISQDYQNSSIFNKASYTFLNKIGKNRFLLIHKNLTFYLSIVDGQILYADANFELAVQPDFVNNFEHSIILANRNGYKNQVVLVSIENDKISGTTNYNHKYHQMVWASEISENKIVAHYKNYETNYGYFCLLEAKLKDNTSVNEYVSFIDDVENNFVPQKLTLSQGNYSYRITSLDSGKAALAYLKKDANGNYYAYARIIEKTDEGFNEKPEVILSSNELAYFPTAKDMLQIFPLSEKRFAVYFVLQSYLYMVECSYNDEGSITVGYPIRINTNVHKNYGFRAKLVAPDTIASIHSYSASPYYSVLNVAKFPKGQAKIDLASQHNVTGSATAQGAQYSSEICSIDETNFLVSTYNGSHTYCYHYSISADVATKQNNYYLTNSHCHSSVEMIQDSDGYFFFIRENEIQLFHFNGTSVTKKNGLSYQTIGKNFHSISKKDGNIILSYTNKTSGCLIFKRNVDKIEIVKNLTYAKEPKVIDGFNFDSTVWDNSFYQLVSKNATDISILNLDLTKPAIYYNVHGNKDAQKYISLTPENMVYALSKDNNINLVVYKQNNGTRRIVDKITYEYHNPVSSSKNYSITKLDSSRFLLCSVDKTISKKVHIRLMKFDGNKLIELKASEATVSSSISIVRSEFVNTDTVLIYLYTNKSIVQTVKFDNDIITTGTQKELVLNNRDSEIAFCSENKVLIGYHNNSDNKIRNSLLTVNNDLTITESSIDEGLVLSGNSISQFKMYSLTDSIILVSFNSNGAKLALIKNDNDNNRTIGSYFNIGGTVRSFEVNDDNSWVLTISSGVLTGTEDSVKHLRLSDDKNNIVNVKSFLLGKNTNQNTKVIKFNDKYLQIGQSDSSIFFSNLVELSRGLQKLELPEVNKITSEFYNSPVCRYNDNLKLQISTKESVTRLYLVNSLNEEVVDSVEFMQAMFTAGGVYKLSNGRVILYYRVSSGEKIKIRLCDIIDNKIVLRDIAETSQRQSSSYFDFSVWEMDDAHFYLGYVNSGNNALYWDKFFIEGRKLKSVSNFSDSSYSPFTKLQFSADMTNCIGFRSYYLSIYQKANDGTINTLTGSKSNLGNIVAASIDSKGDEKLIAVCSSSNNKTYVFRQTSNVYLSTEEIEKRAYSFTGYTSIIKVSFISDEFALCYRMVGTKLHADLLKLGEGTEITLYHHMELDYRLVKNETWKTEANKLSLNYIDTHTGQYKTDEIVYPDVWKYYGYAQETVAKDSLVSVSHQGKISSVHEGLRPAHNYFVDPATLRPTVKPNKFEIGMSLDQNRILLKMPDGLKQFIVNNTMD